MKKIFAASVLTIALIFAGCAAQQPARVEYIGAEAAKELALEDAGIAQSKPDFQKVDMSTRDGIDYYQIEFSSDDGKYSYDIDAITGRIIDSSMTLLGQDGSEREQLHVEENSISSAGGRVAASPEPKTASQASSAAPATRQVNSSGASDMISVDEAKQKALDHAGLSADEVTFVKSGLDRDDGRLTYDLEFYTSDYRYDIDANGSIINSNEYDYDIDPYTGEILQFDYDAEYYSRPAASSSRNSSSSGSPAGSGSITADEAKQKALAQVPGATLNDIREFETDYDDGRLEYEGKIYYDHMEYEFEIDGYSGAIRNWEVESIYD